MTPPAAPSLPVSAIVLAGGRAARLRGISKPDLVVNGARLLDLALAAARSAGAARTVVVGPPELAPAGAILVAEDPPYGGPVAGLAAGLDALDRLGDEARWILVLPADLPRAPAAAALLMAALVHGPDDRVDGLHLIDANGTQQWLTALYRRSALRSGLESGPELSGRSMRSLVGALRLVGVADPAGAGADIDTWDDLAHHQIHARQAQPTPELVTGGDMTERTPARDTPDLSGWIAALAAELGIDAALIDLPTLLGVAGDVAHSVARPAAPVTTFAVALAAMQSGGDLAAVQRAAGKVSALAKTWPSAETPS